MFYFWVSVFHDLEILLVQSPFLQDCTVTFMWKRSNFYWHAWIFKLAATLSTFLSGGKHTSSILQWEITVFHLLNVTLPKLSTSVIWKLCFFFYCDYIANAFNRQAPKISNLSIILLLHPAIRDTSTVWLTKIKSLLYTQAFLLYEYYY